MHGYFLQIDESRMGKSMGNFLRVQTLIDRGYDPMAYRFFCLSANYRAKLNFTWEGMDGAATSLDRLRSSVYEWGEPGLVDEAYVEKFADQVNDDLNMPRALAVVWELVKSELPPSAKKATILVFDRVLGLRLGEWQPAEEIIPGEILAMVEQRQFARKEKRWKDADTLRERVTGAGFEIEDTPEGPRVKRKK
jgi:cysteinyl-tRNA synthetase